MVVPFWSYFDSRSLADLADLIGQVLVFMPLGALLAARSWRQSFAGADLHRAGAWTPFSNSDKSSSRAGRPT